MMGKDGKDTVLGPDVGVPAKISDDDPFQAFDGLISYVKKIPETEIPE